MPKSAQEIIETWPKWKRELAGFKATCKTACKEVSTWPDWKQNALGVLRIKGEPMKKSLSEQIVEQFKAVMSEKKLTQTELGVKMGATPANVSRFLSTSENLTLKTLERIANAIGGEIEIKFIPSKTEIELLKEEIERLKKTWRKALRRKRHTE